MPHTRSVLLLVSSVMLALVSGCAGHAPARDAGAVGVRSDPALAPFAALAGRWRSPSDNGAFEEVWLPPEGTNISGVMRRVGPDGAATLFELLTITAEPDGVRLRLRHFDAGMMPWRSEADGPMVFLGADTAGGVLVFRSEARAGGTTEMIYDLSVPGRLTVTLVFEGDRAPLIIPFERAD